jgi:hypothetical protein
MTDVAACHLNSLSVCVDNFLLNPQKYWFENLMFEIGVCECHNLKNKIYDKNIIVSVNNGQK